MSDRLNAQWRAFGTTIRYAIAGQTIFGLFRMAGAIRDINVQLAEMAALTTPGTGGSAFSSAQVTQLGNSLQRTAIDTLIPLKDVQDAAINFLSTVQNVQPGNAMSQMLEDIGKSATIAQTNMMDLTQAVTTQQIAFGRPVSPKTIGQTTRMWQTMILQAPGGPAASTTIAQAIPGLATMFQLGGGRKVPPQVQQAQMYAMTLGVLRTGMPAATAIRGLQFLLQSIAQPTGKAKGALASIGITPQFVHEQGINAALMKLLGQITRTGNAKQLAAIPEDALDQIDQAGGTLPGIPAEEMGRLRAMIPRIHGVRAAIILASQLQQHGDVQSLAQDLQMMLNVQDENSKQAHDLAQAWENYRKRARLQEATNAINTMALQVAQTFEPVLGFVAQHGITPLAKKAQEHRTATKVGTWGAIAGVGLLAARRLLFGGGGMAAGNALVRGEAIEAAIKGGGALGSSPLNPLYVIVVGQLFGTSYKGIPGGKGGPGGVAKTAEETAKEGGKWWGISRVIKAVRRAPKALGRAGTALEETGARILPRAAKVAGTGAVVGTIFDYFYNAEGTQKAAQDLYPQIKALFPGLTGYKGIESIQQGMLQGHAEIYMTLDINQGGKVTRKRVHIPLSMLYQGGRIPSTQGKAGKTQKGNT